MDGPRPSRHSEAEGVAVGGRWRRRGKVGMGRDLRSTARRREFPRQGGRWRRRGKEDGLRPSGGEAEGVAAVRMSREALSEDDGRRSSGDEKEVAALARGQEWLRRLRIWRG